MAAMTLLASLAAFQDTGTAKTAKPAILVFVGDSDDFWTTLNAVLFDWDQEAEEWYGLFQQLLTQLRQLVAARVVLSVNDSTDVLLQKLSDLQDNQIPGGFAAEATAVGLRPADVAGNPAVHLRGPGNANLALNLGKPFLKLAADTATSDYDDIVYRLPMMPKGMSYEVDFDASSAVRALRQRGGNTAQALVNAVNYAFLLSIGDPHAGHRNRFCDYFTLLRSSTTPASTTSSRSSCATCCAPRLCSRLARLTGR